MSQWINTLNKIKEVMNRFKDDETTKGKDTLAVLEVAYESLEKEWRRMVMARQVLDLKEWLRLDAIPYCIEAFRWEGRGFRSLALIISTWIGCAGYQGEMRVGYRDDEAEQCEELSIFTYEPIAPAEEVPAEAPPSHEHPADEDPSNDLD